MTNIIGRKNRRLLIVCLLAVIASLTLSIGLAGFTRARAEEIEPVAIWTLATESVDYTVSQHTTKEICGVTGSDLQTDAMLWRQDTSASSDTSTNLIYCPSTAMKAAGALYAIHFSGNADKVIGTDINTVIVRIYAHLTADGSSYSIENGGIRLYAPDDTGENDSGYMIPADIPQNQWTNLVISGDDFAKLADKNGCFSGFTAGNATINNLLGNNGYGFADTNCWIAFDTFTAYSEHCVTFDDGASTTSQLVAAGETVTAPSVEKNGYSLLGWYDQTGKKIDLSQPITKSVKLTAKWQPNSSVFNGMEAEGQDNAGNPNLSNRKVQEVYGTPLDMKDVKFSVQNTAAGNNYLTYGVSTNNISASQTVIWNGGSSAISLKNSDGSWKNVVARVYAHLTSNGSSYYVEKGGIRLYGADDNGSNNSGYMIPADIPQNQWFYLEISGEYLADVNGDFSGFAVGSNCVEGVAQAGMYPNNGQAYGVENGWVAFDTFTVGSYVVTFRNGSEITQQLVASGETVSEPGSAPTKANYTFIGWYTENDTLYSFDSTVTESFTLVPKWKHIDGILSSANESDYTFGQSTLTHIAGFTSIGEGSFFNDAPLTVAKYTHNAASLGAKDAAINSALASADNQKAFVYKTHSWGIGRAQNAVNFIATSNVSETDALIIRVYAHLSSGSTYSTNFGGIMLYPLGADGSSGGYQIPADIVQDEWVDLVLTGNDLVALAQGGVLNGFQIGSGFRSSSDSMAYTGVWSQDTGAWILIDSIAAVKGYTVTYLDSDTTTVLKEEIVYQGKTIQELFIPEKDGQVFTGWKQEDIYFDFDMPIRSDVELTVSWAPAADLSDAANNGYYEKGSDFITILDGETEFSSNLIADPSQVVSIQLTESGKLYVISRSGVQSFTLGENEFVKQAHCIITYDRGDGIVIRQVIKQGGYGRALSAESTQRLGYIFNGWKTADGSEFVYGETAVSEDITVSAEWNYDCIAENQYAWYYGAYYDSANSAMIVLKEGNNAVYNGQEYKYYILVSDELVIELNGKEETFNATMYSTKIVAGDSNFYELKSYTVVFDTDGGSNVDSQTVASDQGWKINKPVDPTKEGYVFKGWYLADGTEYDFNSIVSGGFTLFAKWEPVESSNSGGCGSVFDGVSMYLSVIALIGVLVPVLIKKKKLSDK